MDFEAPADAWYVWFGVALVSVSCAGIALQLPSQPPPDATKAVNTIDRVGSSPQQSFASYEHDATEVKLDTRRISMRNDGGTDHASITFGSMTPLYTIEDNEIRQALDRILSGSHPSNVLDELPYGESALLNAISDDRSQLGGQGEGWRQADGVLRIRNVEIAGELVLLVDA